MNILSRRFGVVMAVAAALTFLSFPVSLSAQVQASTGLIRGVVSDSAGRPVEGAIITLRNRETILHAPS